MASSDVSTVVGTEALTEVVRLSDEQPMDGAVLLSTMIVEVVFVWEGRVRRVGLE